MRFLNLLGLALCVFGLLAGQARAAGAPAQNPPAVAAPAEPVSKSESAARMIAELERCDWLSPAQRADLSRTIAGIITADPPCRDKIDRISVDFPKVLEQLKVTRSAEFVIPEGDGFTPYRNFIAWSVTRWTEVRCVTPQERATTLAAAEELYPVLRSWVDVRFVKVPEEIRRKIADFLVWSLRVPIERDDYFVGIALWSGPKPSLEGIDHAVEAVNPGFIEVFDRMQTRYLEVVAAAAGANSEFERARHDPEWALRTLTTEADVRVYTGVLQKYFVFVPEAGPSIRERDGKAITEWAAELKRVHDEERRARDADLRKGQTRRNTREELRDRGGWTSPNGVPQPPPETKP